MDTLKTSLFEERANIFERILETARVGLGLTEQKMMYTLLIPPFELDQFLSIMLKNNLLRYDNQTRSYRTTKEGVGFLDSIRQISKLDSVVE